MDIHDVILIIWAITSALGGFILIRQSKDISALQERVGKLEVAQGKASTQLEYICKSIDEIKELIKNGQKGPL